MKKIFISLITTLIIFISPLTHSSVLSDKISGNQSQTSGNSIKGEESTSKTTVKNQEKPKETAKNQPKMDEIMGFSSSKVKLFFGIAVIFGFFIFGFGRYFLTGKQ